MIPFHHFSRLFKEGKMPITTIDSHTEGETTRLIVAGLGDIPGSTMIEKTAYFKTQYDNVRCLLTKEPRGSRDILAAMVTKSVTPEAAFGLIYMDAKRYPYLCGHATIGAVVTLAQTGFLELDEGENPIVIDTPSGTMAARAFVVAGKVDAVAIEMVPSFVLGTRRKIRVAGVGAVRVDLVCTGGFFAMVDAAALGIEPVMANKDRLVALGMQIIDAANEQLEVVHPIRPDVNTVDVTEFYDSRMNNGRPRGRGLVVYGESHMDRSPCGTGTAAKLALLHHYGRLKMHQPYLNFSPLGTCFEAELVKKTKIGPLDALVTRIKGRAWVTGLHQFILNETDPFQQGYIV
jgi:proline racemase